MRRQVIQRTVFPLSGEPEDWNNWSKVHQAQLFALGCANASKAKGEDVIKIGSDAFDAGDVHLEQMRSAHQAWVPVITACKGVAFDIVQGTE